MHWWSGAFIFGDIRLLIMATLAPDTNFSVLSIFEILLQCA